MIADTESFKTRSQGGPRGGIIVNLDELWLTDMLAKGAAFETIDSKTLM